MALYNIKADHGTPYTGHWNNAIVDLDEATQWCKDLYTKQDPGGKIDGCDTGDIYRALYEGNTSLVEASDKFMEAFNDMAFNGRAMRTIADVAGGAVNVAAHLAGTPLAMRRRQRQIAPLGELNIFVDGSGSAGNDTESLTARGCALLGLVRMLAAIRPVNLYMACGGSFSNPEDAGWHGRQICASVIVRLNATTMDLSRDGFALAHPGFCRAFLFKACKDIPYRKRGVTLGHDRGDLGWELGGIEPYRTHGLTAFCKAVGCAKEQSVFFTPMYHGEDQELQKNPAQWIKNMMVKYGAQSAFDMEAD